MRTSNYRDIAIVNPGQLLLALELYPVDAAAMAARFSRDVLVDIQATMPLEPETAARVAEAVAILATRGRHEGQGAAGWAQTIQRQRGRQSIPCRLMHQSAVSLETTDQCV